MSPTKHSATKKSSKHPRTDSENFRTIEADIAYNDFYKKATIIMERIVKMETLENTYIPELFKERTRTKLLNPSGRGNSLQVPLWTEIISRVGYDKKNSLSQGIPFKSS